MKRLSNRVFQEGKEVELFTDENALQEIVLKSIDNLKHFLSLSHKTYSYRGQSNYDWNLQTSFERFLNNKTCRIAKTNIEQKIVKQYRSESSVFTNELGYDPHSQNELLDTLADIQHYGGPTRLLDWTSSFNIALFFAIYNNDEFDAAVYCLRNIQFNGATFDITDIFKNQNISEESKKTLPPPLDKNKLLKFHYPKRRNRRITAQNGYFIYPLSTEATFEESLSYVLDGMPIKFVTSDNSIEEILLKSTLVKVKIPQSIIPEMRKYLLNSGISAKTLFPDHYGAIQSLYEISTDTF